MVAFFVNKHKYASKENLTKGVDRTATSGNGALVSWVLCECEPSDSVPYYLHGAWKSAPLIGAYTKNDASGGQQGAVCRGCPPTGLLCS